MNLWLDADDIATAATVGIRRQLNAIAKGLDTNVRDVWDAHINGAAAELALSRKLNLYWNVMNMNAADLGGFVEVRARRMIDHDTVDFPTEVVLRRGEEKNRGKLIRAFVLTHVYRPRDRCMRVRVLGWIYGTDAKTLGEWDERMRAVVVHPGHFRDINTLGRNVLDVIDAPIEAAQ